MKILFFIVLYFFQSLHEAEANYSIEQLRQQEAALLKEWHQQQGQISQVLRQLRKIQSASHPLVILSSRNLKDLVHQNLAIRSFDGFFKKQHTQVIKLCNDIAQVRQHLKMTNNPLRY